jgi:hypothetical protein
MVRICTPQSREIAYARPMATHLRCSPLSGLIVLPDVPVIVQTSFSKVRNGVQVIWLYLAFAGRDAFQIWRRDALETARGHTCKYPRGPVDTRNKVVGLCCRMCSIAPPARHERRVQLLLKSLVRWCTQ